MTTHIRQRQPAASWVVFLGIALVASSASSYIIADDSSRSLPWQQPSNSRSGGPDPWHMDQASRAEALLAVDRLKEHGHKANRVEVQQTEREFLDNLAEFTNTWNALMENRTKGVWDAKKARQTRKAFERLVHSQGWVESSKR